VRLSPDGVVLSGGVFKGSTQHRTNRKLTPLNAF